MDNIALKTIQIKEERFDKKITTIMMENYLGQIKFQSLQCWQEEVKVIPEGIN